MKTKSIILLSAFLIMNILATACAGLIPLEDEPITSDYGPIYSAQEHQTRTFEVLWKNLEENYVYFDSADVDWASIRGKYQNRIKAGLTNEGFSALLHELESDLPAGTLIYQSRAERIEADITDFSTYDGIGAFVGFQAEESPHVVILSVIEGSPAERAGLKAHDSIFEINGEPVRLEEGLDVVNRIRGPAGSAVTLNVQSPGRAERSIEVERARLATTGKLETREIAGTNYGYMLFPPLGYEALVEDVLDGLQTFAENKTSDGLILDLRVASAAQDWPLEALLTIFYDGMVGEIYNRNNKQPIQVTGQDLFESQSIPLIILVGQNTRGFPEVFAAGLQTHKRATVIGSNTPGSIETSSPFYLPDGSRIFLETTSFKLPDADRIGSDGVRPDVLVDAGWDEVLPNADPVIDVALKTFEVVP